MWQNQPTIQYSPLEGQEYAMQMLKPMDIAIINQLIYSGWDIDRVFLLTIHALSEYQNLSKELDYNPKGQEYENFLEVLMLLRKLQKEGSLQTGIVIPDNDEKKSKIFQLAFPANAEDSAKIAFLLDEEDPANGKYIINISEGFDLKGNIGILPRSLLACMYYLAGGIIVPKEDIESKKAIAVKEEDNRLEKIYRRPLIVYSSSCKPSNSYVSIKYRECWFYIKDNDLHSKKTFMLLLELYNLQSGNRQSKGPVLTLPIGVG